MVEEERTQIGTMKALGYSKVDIAAKYLLYALFATVGAKILASKDAQKVYVYTTAAALREKEDVMSVVTNIKEIAGDVLADAKAFNEKRAAEQAEVIEDTAEKAE